MTVLHILHGAPGAGKSHFARELAARTGAAIVNMEALIDEHFQGERTKRNRSRAANLRNEELKRILRSGSAISSDTNLQASTVRSLATLARSYGPPSNSITSNARRSFFATAMRPGRSTSESRPKRSSPSFASPTRASTCAASSLAKRIRSSCERALLKPKSMLSSMRRALKLTPLSRGVWWLLISTARS